MDDIRMIAAVLEVIPKEMYWAYEAVRRSGYYNMFCYDRRINGNIEECKELIQVIDDAYIRFCVYTNADISQPMYKHVTIDHIKFIQQTYDILSQYYEEMPENVVNLKREVKTIITM